MHEKLMIVLDDNKPNWWLEWADQRDLLDLAKGTTKDEIRRRVAMRIFHPVLHAALVAGIMHETSNN